LPQILERYVPARRGVIQATVRIFSDKPFLHTRDSNSGEHRKPSSGIAQLTISHYLDNRFWCKV
jgi:hypothetical protein